MVLSCYLFHTSSEAYASDRARGLGRRTRCSALTGMKWSVLGRLKKFMHLHCCRLLIVVAIFFPHVPTCIRTSHYTLLSTVEMSPRPEALLVASWVPPTRYPYRPSEQPTIAYRVFWLQHERRPRMTHAKLFCGTRGVRYVACNSEMRARARTPQPDQADEAVQQCIGALRMPYYPHKTSVPCARFLKVSTQAPSRSSPSHSSSRA